MEAATQIDEKGAVEIAHGRASALRPANLMKGVIATSLLCLACACGAGAVIPASIQPVAQSLPPQETRILCEVADEYGLSTQASKLLLTIRLIENGRPGLELGVGSNYPNHPARRFARNPALSLRVQARWAAGTIRLRYAGDLDAFARIYCPPAWQHWARMARYWMDEH